MLEKKLYQISKIITDELKAKYSDEHFIEIFYNLKLIIKQLDAQGKDIVFLCLNDLEDGEKLTVEYVKVNDRWFLVDYNINTISIDNMLDLANTTNKKQDFMSLLLSNKDFNISINIGEEYIFNKIKKYLNEDYTKNILVIL